MDEATLKRHEMLHALVCLYRDNVDLDLLPTSALVEIERLERELGFGITQDPVEPQYHMFCATQPADATFTANDGDTMVLVKKIGDDFRRVQSSKYGYENIWPRTWSNKSWPTIDEAASIGGTLKVKRQS